MSLPKIDKKESLAVSRIRSGTKNQDLEQEWLQLIQIEREIEKRRNQLRETEAGNQRDPDLDDLPLDEEDEDIAKQNERLEDGDLEWVNSIFNAFPNPTFYRQNSNQPKLKSITAKDALTRVHITNAAAKI